MQLYELKVELWLIVAALTCYRTEIIVVAQVTVQTAVLCVQ